MSDDGLLPGERLNVVDRVVAFFNPNAGFHRMAAREALHEFGYDAANPGTRRGGSGGMSKNANSESHVNGRDRIKIMWDARDLATNDWIGGVLGRVVLYVLGDLSCRSNTGDPEIDALYDADFNNWAGLGEETDDNSENESLLTDCDMTGRHNLLKMGQLGLLAMLVDGDHGFIPVPDENPDGSPAANIRFQQIESDRIGSPIEAAVGENYIGGMTVDAATGRIQTVRVFDRTRFGNYINPKELDPWNFIHLWDPFRCDQYRGVSALKAITPHSRDIKEWLASEKMAGKVQSQYAALVGSKDPYAKNGAAKWEGKTTEGTPTQNAEYGKILRMAEGESFSFVQPGNRPSGAFLAGLQTIVRIIAICLDLPYGFVWDLSTLGGVSQRVEVEQAQRRINYFRRIVKDQFLRRARRMRLARSIAFGLLPPHPNWRKCQWHFGKWITTDAGYETQNDIAMVKMGGMPMDGFTEKYGHGGILEVARKNASTIKALQGLAAETGVPIEMLVPDWQPQATDQLASMATPPPPPPKPGSLEAVGDKGAGQIVEILSQVTTGQLDRQSAVETLVTVYGISREKAEAIVPEQGKQIDTKAE
jgi:hypothetical protein